MRDFKGMKRQRGRNRGGGSGGGGGGKPQPQNANRAFDSNGPEGVKVRGNAQHVFEKYQQLARDASSAGDRVLGENYLQHAEHYFRLLRAMQPTRPPARSWAVTTSPPATTSISRTRAPRPRPRPPTRPRRWAGPPARPPGPPRGARAGRS